MSQDRVGPSYSVSQTQSLNRKLDRRQFAAASGALLTAFATVERAAANEPFQFRYLLGSCMYGYQYLGEILPEVRKCGATAIDIWPKVHGNQREQLDDLGEGKFQEMMEAHGVTLGCITQYKLGPFRLEGEMRLAKRLGCKTIVTAAQGPKGLEGTELKLAIQNFVEAMKPHLEVAEETGVTIAIENHGNNLVESPDAMRWLLELSEGMKLAIALAPYHLPQDSELLAQLIREFGPRMEVFYAWQHGKGCMTKLPKKQELLQMPGRGELDFGPMVQALRETNYSGWTEIFMHPVPRGVPILETATQVSEEINVARNYLEELLRKNEA